MGTDPGLMSASLSETHAISELPEGESVLWHMLPQAQTGSSSHHGADISSLSQFGHEREILYPPCTMLVAQKVKAGWVFQSETADVKKPKDAKGKKKDYSVVKVVPIYV